MKTEQEQLSLKIIDFARRQIADEAPFLLQAVYALRPIPREDVDSFETDGVHLFFTPARIIGIFQQERDRIARALLHVTLHCLLGHVTARRSAANEEAYDVAADLKVFSLSRTLCPSLFPPFEASSEEPPLPILMELFESNERLQTELRKQASAIQVDTHALWPSNSSASCEAPAVPDDSDSRWQEYAASIFEAASRICASQEGGLSQLCREIEATGGSGVSYGDLLRNLMTPKEVLTADPDSIDPRWYHLGMALYGDIPLLEPSEQTELPVPDTLVVAVDTSLSCSDEHIELFLNETLQMLRDLSGLYPNFQVLLLECDKEIQKSTLLTNFSQLDDFLRKYTPEGFGCTDFRPVFHHVDALQQEGSLHRVSALLYFTDADGPFPQSAPDYPVFCIGLAQDAETLSQCPHWVQPYFLNLKSTMLQEVPHETTGN